MIICLVGLKLRFAQEVAELETRKLHLDVDQARRAQTCHQKSPACLMQHWWVTILRRLILIEVLQNDQNDSSIPPYRANVAPTSEKKRNRVCL